MRPIGGKSVRSMARAILEAVDDEKDKRDAEKNAPPGPPAQGDVDKVVTDEPEEDPPFAPDANMTIKDEDPEGSRMPREPGGIDLKRANEKAVEAGMLPIPEGLDLDLYDLYDGAKHELEHTGDFDLAVAIAAHHVGEHPRYYEFLERMEDEMEKEKQSREPGVSSDEADREVGKGKREPSHSMDPHDGEGEDDGW